MESFVAALGTVIAVFVMLRLEISGLRRELRGEVSSLRSEMRSELSALRMEIREALAAVNARIDQLMLALLPGSGQKDRPTG